MGTFDFACDSTASLRSAGLLDVLICTPASAGLRAPRIRAACEVSHALERDIANASDNRELTTDNYFW